MALTPSVSLDTVSALLDQAVMSHLQAFQRRTARSIPEDSPELQTMLTGSVHGGKRFRAVAAVIGALVASRNDSADLGAILDPDLLALGTALEFYQASALVHDDVVDRSDARRGGPSLHVALSRLHASRSWHGSGEHFGIAGAILVGDYLLAAADEALAQVSGDGLQVPLQLRFSLMTGEVAYGQYLELRATQTDLHPEDMPRSLQVVKLKSARYSVMHPIVLGAISQKASTETIAMLEAIFEPVGIAFQLRDDYLGVFGDPEVTGKPVGTDLIEKKRTPLLALSFANADAASRARLQDFFTAEEPAEAPDIAVVSDIIARCGRTAHEAMIAEYRDRAVESLRASPFSENAKAACWSLIDRLIERDS